MTSASPSANVNAAPPPRLRTAADLDAETRAAFLQFTLSLADTKYWLGRRISDWANGAPALEASVGAAAIAQDELGHARSLFAMLGGFPGAPPELNTETDLARSVRFNPAALERPWPTWLDAVAGLVLLDGALRQVFEAARASRYEPLAGRAAKILQEEHFHHLFGRSWLARLATASPAASAQMQQAVERQWAVAAAWFGPPGEPGLAALQRAGILALDSAGLYDAWQARAAEVVRLGGLTLPAAPPDWSRWQAARRHTPQPEAA